MYFRHGLQKETDSKIIQHRPIPKTLLDTITIATAYEQTRNRGIHRQFQQKTYGTSSASVKAQYNPYNEGNKQNIKCHKCGKMGHIEKQCFSNKPKINYSSNYKAHETSKSGANTNYKKPLNRREGQIYMTSTNEEKLLTVTGSLNKIPITYVIDTAAINSDVSSKFVGINKLIKINTKTRLLVAQAQPVTSLGQIKEAEVTITNVLWILL